MKYFIDPKGNHREFIKKTFGLDKSTMNTLKLVDRAFSRQKMSDGQVKEYLAGLTRVARIHHDNHSNLWTTHLDDRQREFAHETGLCTFVSGTMEDFNDLASVLMKDYVKTEECAFR